MAAVARRGVVDALGNGALLDAAREVVVHAAVDVMEDEDAA